MQSSWSQKIDAVSSYTKLFTGFWPNSVEKKLITKEFLSRHRKSHDHPSALHVVKGDGAGTLVHEEGLDLFPGFLRAVDCSVS